MASIASAASKAQQLVNIAREMIDKCWETWQTKVPRQHRWLVYGALLGIGIYLILGFGTGGVIAGRLAALIQSSIGNVTAKSAFATMQSLGAKGILAWLMPLLGAVGVAGFRELFELLNQKLGNLAPDVHSTIRNVTAELGSALEITQSPGSTGMLAPLMPLLEGHVAGIRGAAKSAKERLSLGTI